MRSLIFIINTSLCCIQSLLATILKMRRALEIKEIPTYYISLHHFTQKFLLKAIVKPRKHQKSMRSLVLNCESLRCVIKSLLTSIQNKKNFRNQGDPEFCLHIITLCYIQSLLTTIVKTRKTPEVNEIPNSNYVSLHYFTQKSSFKATVKTGKTPEGNEIPNSYYTPLNYYI